MELRNTIRHQILARTHLCVALALLLIGYGLASAADWPNWRGPNYTGISNETGWLSVWPEAGPTVAWEAALGTGFASMTVSQGRVYAAGNIEDRDIVYCFDADSGKEIWKQSYACPLFKKNHEGGPCGTPTVAADGVYVFSKNADVLRLNPETGAVVWHKNLVKDLGVKHPTWHFSSSCLLVDNLVIVNAGSAGVALNRADGSIVWKSGTGPAGYATGVPRTIEGQKCVVLFTEKDVMGIAAATGKVEWSHEWHTKYEVNAADPIIVGDMVFISSGYNKGCALLKLNGAGVTELWNNKNMRNHFNSSVLWDGYLYGFDESTLTCLDFKTGEIQWSQGGLGKGSLMLADGKLIILSEKGELVIAEAAPEGYKALSSAKILTGKCWTVPVLANGRIYARNAAGDLVCVDVRAKN